MTQASPKPRADQAPVARHVDDMDWETIRWPGETGKMLFHPRPENPTEPNAGLLRFEAGAHHPLHRHHFAQVWYVLEGRFRMGGREYGPGTMIWHADPHYEEELATDTGGLMLIVQYPGPTTGGRPIYDDRFNMAARKPLHEERTDV
ncbi:MAG TPA: cupin domain-containing protein [Burkholderiales bacterium]|nr:cupin domain-containing protein [Burkholderiales bacterium]